VLARARTRLPQKGEHDDIIMLRNLLPPLPLSVCYVRRCCRGSGQSARGGTDRRAGVQPGSPLIGRRQRSSGEALAGFAATIAAGGR